MGANTFGERFRITTFGESHGRGLGVVIDGCPAGVSFDNELLMHELGRRRPGARVTDSARREPDEPEILSGIYEGETLGTPIAVVVRNQDARSEDYERIKSSPRRGHADDVWRNKFGRSDPRGGGRASGRETLCRVIAGAFAQMFLGSAAPEMRVVGFAKQIGPFRLDEAELDGMREAVGSESLEPSELVDGFPARFPNVEKSKKIQELLVEAKREGRSYGGVAEIWIHRPPANLGQPVFHKLKSDLARGIMSVGAVAGVEMGAGFEATASEGSQFHSDAPESVYGGIRGGISTGEPITLRAAFKPTATVLDEAKKGRHDPCIVPRAIPVLEAMVRLCLADHLLWQRTDRLED